MTTIRSSREIDAMFRAAAKTPHPLLILLCAKTPEYGGSGGRLAVVAGKRLGGAVLRNRAKRVLREAARRAAGPWAGFDVVLVARPGTATARACDLDAALASVLSRGGVRS